MIKSRRSVSAVITSFTREVQSLENFANSNQTKFAAGVLSKKELVLLTETVFFRCYRHYENFIRDIFLLYCREKNTLNGRRVLSYLKPSNYTHTEELIKSSMHFLDWTSPDIIIQRSELYLQNGFPIKLAYTAHKDELNRYKKIRNHIAHNSIESYNQYIKVVKGHFGVVPLTVPTPGEFLLLISPTPPLRYYLLQFFDTVKQVAQEITNVS